MSGRGGSRDKWDVLLSLGPFKGLDPTTAPYYVAPENFPDGENFVSNRLYGAYTTVQGRVTLLAQTLPNTPTGIFCMDRVGVPDVYLFALTNNATGEIWAGSIGGVATKLTAPALTPNRVTQFCKLGNWVFVTNGVDTPLKIDASLNVTNWGIVKPATAPTVASGGAGNLNGQYYWCVTFGVQSSGQESSQGAIFGPLTLTNNSASLTAIPTSTDSQVNQRNIYRLGGALGQWRLVGTINDNTTTTFTDNLADASVTGQSLTVFRDPPPVFTAICSHQGRVWGFGTATNTGTVWFSNYNEPWGFNLNTGWLPVDQNAFDDGAVACASIGTQLMLFKKRSTYAVAGSTDADFFSYFLFGVGCESALSVAPGFGYVFWLSRQGVYWYSGGAFDPIVNNLSDGNFQQSNIKAVLDGLGAADRNSAVGFIYDRMYHLSLPTIGKTWLFDLRSRGWYRIGWATTLAWYDIEDQVTVVAVNLNNVGQVDQWFAADTDLGNAITSFVLSRTTDSGMVGSTMHYRLLQVEAPLQTGALVTATVTVDPTESGGGNAFTLPTQIDLGTGPPRHQESLPALKGFACNVKLTVTSTQRVVIERVVVKGRVDRDDIEPG